MQRELTVDVSVSPLLRACFDTLIATERMRLPEWLHLAIHSACESPTIEVSDARGVTLEPSRALLDVCAAIHTLE